MSSRFEYDGSPVPIERTYCDYCENEITKTQRMYVHTEPSEQQREFCGRVCLANWLLQREGKNEMGQMVMNRIQTTARAGQGEGE